MPIYVVYMYIYLPMYAINLNTKEMLIALCNSNKTTLCTYCVHSALAANVFK